MPAHTQFNSPTRPLLAAAAQMGTVLVLMSTLLISCGDSGSLAIPAKISPNLGASRDVSGSGNGMAFKFKTIPNINYPAGYFSGGREYFWGVQLTLPSLQSGETKPLAADTYQVAFISDSFAVPNTYELSEIIAGGAADIYQLKTLGDTTSFQRIESAKVRADSEGLVLDISDSEILRPKLESSPPEGFTAIAEGNLMASQRFVCVYSSGVCE